MYRFLYILFLVVAIKDVFWFRNELGFGVGFILLLIFGYTLFLKKQSSVQITIRFFVVLYLIISFLFLWFCSDYHDISFLRLVQFYRQLTIPFSLFLIFYSLKEGISVNLFKKYFIPIVVIEFFLGFMQYLNIAPAFIFQTNSAIDNLFHGTFSNNNFLGNFFTIFSIILYFEFVDKRYLMLSKNKFYLIMLIAIIGIFLSGIRTSLVVLFAGILLANIMTPGKRKLVWIILLGSTLFVNSISNMKTYFVGLPSVTRILEGIEEVTTESDLKNSRSTVSLSLRLYELFTKENNIWIGHGKLFKGGYRVVDSGNSTIELSVENKNETDATLMVILVEFGIVGLIIFLLPTFFLIKISSDTRKTVVFFIVLLLLTITDIGVFYSLNLLIVLFYLRITNKKLDINNSISTVNLNYENINQYTKY